MTCAPFDIKDYMFGELKVAEKDAVNRHLLACSACQDELAALNATSEAVMFLREEEPPRRIAFVSDKVFEPRWWQRLFASGPQLGFASAAMLAMAIVFHATYTPAAAPQAPPPAMAAQIDPSVIEAEVAKRLDAAVQKVAVEIEERSNERLIKVVNERLAQQDRVYRMDLQTVAEYMDRMSKRQSNMRRVAYDTGVTQQ
jgi:anti-sigma factor RsiW